MPFFHWATFIYNFYLISLYAISRLGIIITIQMKLLLEARSGHLPKNSRSLTYYEYKSESHNVYLKFRINQHLQGH